MPYYKAITRRDAVLKIAAGIVSLAAPLGCKRGTSTSISGDAGLADTRSVSSFEEMKQYLLASKSFEWNSRFLSQEQAIQIAYQNGWTPEILRHLESYLSKSSGAVPLLNPRLLLSVIGPSPTVFATRKILFSNGDIEQAIRINLHRKKPVYSLETFYKLIDHEINHARISHFKPFRITEEYGRFLNGEFIPNYLAQKNPLIATDITYLISNFRDLGRQLEEITAWAFFNKDDPANKKAVKEWLDDWYLIAPDLPLDIKSFRFFISKTFGFEPKDIIQPNERDIFNKFQRIFGAQYQVAQEYVVR